MKRGMREVIDGIVEEITCEGFASSGCQRDFKKISRAEDEGFEDLIRVKWYGESRSAKIQVNFEK